MVVVRRQRCAVGDRLRWNPWIGSTDYGAPLALGCECIVTDTFNHDDPHLPAAFSLRIVGDESGREWVGVEADWEPAWAD